MIKPELKEYKKDLVYCEYCKGEMTGCPCSWRKTQSGGVVHRKCYPDYEVERKKKLKDSKPTCAYCGGEFKGKPYFMAIDGRYVHFACRVNYENKLIEKSKQ
tara:strand:- start:1282 stop:1587 length:306 start_codon:yes stop_codon:yes gene_type:complete